MEPAVEEKVLMSVTCPACGASAKLVDTFLMSSSTVFNCIVSVQDRDSVSARCLERANEDEHFGGKIKDQIRDKGRCTCAAMAKVVTAGYLGGR